MATRSYLTFNTSIQSISLLESIILKHYSTVREVKQIWNLRNTWKLWIQNDNEIKKDYSDNMKSIYDFSTIKGFWVMWELLPQPSQLMGGKRMIYDVPNEAPENVTGMMIFRDGIKPMWEDEMNAQGGHFEIRYPISRNIDEQAQLDEHWNNIILAMIGGSIEPFDIITGVRLVDRLTIQGRPGGFIRIEIWFWDYTRRQILLENIQRILTTKLDGTKNPTSFSIRTKSHMKPIKENNYS